MKKDMPLEGLRWSRDSGSALYDTPQTAVLGRAGGEPNTKFVTKHVSNTPVSGGLRAASRVFIRLRDYFPKNPLFPLKIKFYG